VKRWAAIAAALATVSGVVWVLVAAGAPSGSTPATVRLAIYGNGRLIRALTVAVCGKDESCPANVFPPIPPGAPQLSGGDVLLVRVSRTVPLITVTARVPMQGIPGSGTAHAPSAPASPVTLARRRVANTIRVRLPRGIAGTQWVVLTFNYDDAAATVPVPVRVGT